MYTWIRETFVLLVATVFDVWTALYWPFNDWLNSWRQANHAFFIDCLCSVSLSWLLLPLWWHKPYSALLYSNTKSMTVCLIKEWDTSLKQHQAAYEIFRWRRGRQYSKNRVKWICRKHCRERNEITPTQQPSPLGGVFDVGLYIIFEKVSFTVCYGLLFSPLLLLSISILLYLFLITNVRHLSIS